jgi:hypothetical protein
MKTTHDHPHAQNPHAPKNFDFEKFATFCARGFSHGVGKADGAVCVEAAISLCSGEGLGDKPTCVHPVIRAHAIRLNDSRWSSSESRAKGMCDYGLAQLGTTDLDGKQFARRLAFLTITQLLPVALRAAKLESEAVACEQSAGLEQALACARLARDAAAYAAAAAAYAAAAAAAYAAAAAADAAYDAAAAADAVAAAAADAAADAVAAAAADAAARDRVLSQAARLAIQAIEEVRAGMVQP